MPKKLTSCVAVVIVLAAAGCGGSSSTDDNGSTAGGTRTTATLSTSERTSLDAYRANVTVSDFCGAIVNDSGPRDVRALSHAVDDLIDFHRDADNDESRGLLRDAAAMLRDCSDFTGDTAGTDAADRLTEAVDAR